MLLTACHVQVAGLLIKGEESEVHAAGADERDADTVENVAVRVDSDVEVGRQNVVELANLLVPEESVRHPDLADVGQGQVFDFICQEK